jgi:predicted nucleic-acid-binding protein
MNHCFVDTNYFLRLILKDVDHQYQEVCRVFAEAVSSNKRLFTSSLVYFEVAWVLVSVYKKGKNDLIKHLEEFLRLSFIDIEHRSKLADTIKIYKESSLSLEDCYYIIYGKAQNASLLSFDKKLLKVFNKL